MRWTVAGGVEIKYILGLVRCVVHVENISSGGKDEQKRSHAERLTRVCENKKASE